ncbi:MAG: VWA domain-containing protein, partial [Candidatus Zixiibacteriota bacterium]
MLIFSVGYEHSSDPGVSAVTYGGQPLTRIDGGAVGSSTRNRAELWYLNEAGILAASGNTFSVTWGGSTPSERKYGAATYANVRQIGPIGDSDVQTDGNGSPSTITATVNVVTGGMVVSDVINGNTGGFTWNNGYVEGFDQGSGTSTLSAADHQEFADGTSTASATHNNASRRVIVAAALMPADATQSLDSLNISQLDPSQFPDICLYVEALDNSGNPYPGLTPDSFCLFQDTNAIGSFTVEELTVDSCRTATCLVIDVSGSMAGANMTAAKAAASEFVRNMDIFDRAAVVSFSYCYTVVQNFTSDTTLLLSAINGLVANGYTAYLDGVYRGVELTVPELGSKAVINLTDGLENYSGNCAGGPDGLGDGFADDSALIVNLALGAGIPIYSITLGSGFDPQYAQKLAYATGGAYYHAPLPSQLDAIYAEIKERLCTRYKICYTSPDTVQNGDCHDVIICYEESPGVCVECDTADYCEQFPPVITRTPATIALDNTCQRWDQAVQLCAYVTDGDTPLSSLMVTLFYRNNNVSPYTSVATTRTDSTFCAYIPASALVCGGDSIQYYFTASDGSVTVASPANAPIGHHAFPICPNVAPVCSVPNDTTIGQCSIVQVCLPVSGTDVNGNLQSCTKISGPGTLSGGQWCYTPAGSETVNVTVRCTDSCGLYCEESFSVTFQANTAPVCSVPNDTSIFQCTATQVCLPVAGLDGDGNLTGCTIMSGPGTLSGGNWCYTPAGDEVANVTIRCTDACGAYCEETFSVTFTINDPPVISLGPDISQPYNFNGDTICFNYNVSDPQGYAGLVEAVVSAPGGYVLDTSANTLCLQNPAPGNYQFIMSVTDPCGAVDYDTAWIFIASTAPPTCNMPADTSILQCAAAQICLPVSATSLYPPVNCVVTSGPGSISGGNWCYTPVGDASFTVHVTCTDSLGAVCNDSFSVNIDINDAPICASIADTTIFQCSPAQVCRPVSATDANGNLSGCAVVSGPGTVSGGNWCYTPAGDETVNVTIRCTDACGAYCEETFSVTFQINEAPVCNAISDTTYFQCAPTQVCRPVGATDADGNFASCTVVAGPGTVSGGNWCYTPAGDETVNVTIRCTDACGAYCEETFSVTFQINEAPVCNAISDTTYFQCAPAQVCRPVGATDADGNFASCTVVAGPGTVSGG